ncbi:hypothetical protein HK096_002347, partial [Nowakowskiella sp. JEL0078]
MFIFQCVVGTASSSTVTTTKTSSSTSKATSTTSTTSTTGASKTTTVTTTTTTVTTTTTTLSTVTPTTGFVKASGTAFSLNGCTKHFSGVNSYYLTYQSTALIDEHLTSLGKHSNYNVIRTWAFCENTCGLITFSGTTLTFTSSVFNKLDYLLAQASLKGFKVILALTNNWQDYGGMDIYTKNLGGTYHDDFYTKASIKAGFKQYISWILNRVNSVNGIIYKNDPTIFGWEIANEARCVGGGLAMSSACVPSVITSWYDEISKYIKTIDKNHLVGTGDEGMGLTSPSGATAASNDVYSISSTGYNNHGGDFKSNLALTAIDFGTFHFYPTNWLLTSLPQDGIDWIDAHMTVSTAVGKPVFFEEFGIKDKTLRQNYYGSWFTESATKKIGGIAFWMFAGASYADYDGYTLYDADMTSYMDANGAKITSLNS